MYIEVYSNAHGRLLTYPQQGIATGLAAGLLLVGLVIAAPAAPLNRLFRLRPIVWVGTISYGLYIYFIPVFIVVMNYTFVLHGWKVNYYIYLARSGRSPASSRWPRSAITSSRSASSP